MKLSPEAIEAFDLKETFVPINLRDGLRRHLEQGVPTGSFLYAVLSNNLRDAVFRADPVTLVFLPNIVRWVFNHAPINSHGSETKVATWQEIKRLDALEAQ